MVYNDKIEKQIVSEKVNLDRLGMLLLYMSVTLEIIIVIVDKSNYINPIEGQLFRITFLLAAFKVMVSKYSIREWAALFAFGIFGAVCYKITGRNEILRIVLFIAACKNADIKKILKYVFYTTLAGCLLLVLLSVTGIYGRLALESDFGRGYTQIRYCLGIGHPNALHCMFLMLMLLGLYLYNERLKWYHYIMAAMLNYGLYLLTDSNTGMLMTSCTILGAVVIRYAKGITEKKWIYIAGAAVFLFCVIFSIMAADGRIVKPYQYQLQNSWMNWMDMHLNGRIRDLYYGSMNSEGTTVTWTLFSRPENSYYFDMGFVRLFYWYGIIPGMIYIMLNILLIRQLYKKKDGMGLVMITVLAIYTIVEAHIISVYIGRNYLLFLMGMYGSSMLGIISDKEDYFWHIYRLTGKPMHTER